MDLTEAQAYQPSQFASQLSRPTMWAGRHRVNAFAHLVLLAFAPAAALLFRSIPHQYAVSITTIGGFLFLPILSIPLSGLPDYTKELAISTALALGVVVSQKKIPRIAKLYWWDALYCAWILALPTSYLLNGYPTYNCASSLFIRVVEWGIPFWIGRSCFQSRESVRTYLQVIVIGGLVYVPLALWEVRMSPQLHTDIYGAFQHSFLQMVRGDSFRPIVFTSHALVTALWFATALTAAAGLRRMRGNTPKWMRNAWWIAPVLGISLLLCRSAGALVLGALAYAALAFRLGRLALAMAIAASITYVVSRIFFDATTAAFVADLLQFLPPERAQSFQYRIDMETQLLERAWGQPLIGWCNEGFKSISTTSWDGFEVQAKIVSDSLWIIVFGTSGFLGLIPLYGTLLASSTRGLLQKMTRGVSEAQVLSTIAAIIMINSVPNGHVGPVAIMTVAAALGVRANTVPKHLTTSRSPDAAHKLIEPRGPSKNSIQTLDRSNNANS